MDEQEPQKIDGPESAEPKEEWVRPQVDQLRAGGAEATDGADTDGPTLS